jgi:aspartate/methionine/tyrosine aminotransferase
LNASARAGRFGNGAKRGDCSVKPANAILSGYGTTVFEVMSRLAIEHESINLGQGFPDGNGPDDVRRVAEEALESSPNQYPPMMGVPELRQAVAAHNKRFYGLEVDWQSEVLVTSGATEALAACLFGLIEPGDEVVLIEPLYDSYLPIVRRAGGVPKMIRVEPPDWALPRQALADAFSDQTKLILLNSPMNPSAKVFDREELDFVADLLIKHDAYAVCDEVYEHIVFDGCAHIPLMTLPGMRGRCARIGSAGKTFSLTGWKVGYITAPPEMLGPITKCHQFLVFTTPPNLQRATAYGLEKGDDYFISLGAGLEAKRDRFARGLARVGFDAVDCHGTYFITGDFRPLGFNGDDVEFCSHITTEAGVTAVPVSAFYQDDPPRYFARFAFCKEDAVLDQAIDRLAAHFGGK